jgi:Tol biopolymer transport system component
MRILSSSLLTIIFGLSLTTPAALAFDSRIAFLSHSTGTWQIYTVRPDGSEIVQVTDMPPTEWDAWFPSFSKDGKRIAFCYGTVDQNGNVQTDLFSVNVNSDGSGGEVTQLTDDGLSCDPHWSPDQKHIVFARRAETGLDVVTVMNSDGSGKKSGLTSRFWESAPAGYTTDGKQIVFGSEQGGLVSAAWIMDVHGTNQHRLTPAFLEGAPTDVSPDGQRVLFFNHNDTILTQLLYTVDITTNEIAQVTHSKKKRDCCEFLSSYSPDGSRIALISNRFNPLGLDLLTVDLNGKHFHQIVKDIGFGGVSWGLVSK